MDSKRLIVNQKTFQKKEETEFVLTSQIFHDKPILFSFDWAKLYGKKLIFRKIQIQLYVEAF
jgi:hypothetical protein